MSVFLFDNYTGILFSTNEKLKGEGKGKEEEEEGKEKGKGKLEVKL